MMQARPPETDNRAACIGLNALVAYTGATFRNAGVSRYTARLIDAILAARPEHRFHIFVNESVREPPFTLRPNAAIERTRLPTSRTPVRVAWEQLVAPWRVAAARLHLLHSFLNVAPLAAPTRHVVTVHDLSFLKLPTAHPWRRRWYLSLATWLSVRRARAVLADSQATKADLIARLGVNASKVTVVYPGADPEFHPRPDGEVARFRATHRLERPFVLFVGTIEPRKNVDVVVRAFARLRREAAFNGELVIAGGDGWGGVRLDEEIAEGGFGADIRRLGYVKQEALPFWYTAADLVVYPSSYEGFGIPVLEAMASGTPVVTSNQSCLPEVVGEAGATVDPRNDEQLAASMAQVLASPERRVHMRAQGLERARRFQWTTAAQRCLSVYQRVLSRY